MAASCAAIRKRSTEEHAQSNARVGRDGKVRTLDSSEGRRRAATGARHCGGYQGARVGDIRCWTTGLRLN